MEYILLVAAVGFAFIIFLNYHGPMRNALEKSVNSTVLQINHVSNQIKFSSP